MLRHLIPLLLLAVLLLPACSTTVSIPSTRPGPVAVGPARHLVILDGAGRRYLRRSIVKNVRAITCNVRATAP